MTAACRSGKVRYPDETTAKVELAGHRAADALRRRWRAKTPCRVYRCWWCEGWHLTSKPLAGAR